MSGVNHLFGRKETANKRKEKICRCARKLSSSRKANIANQQSVANTLTVKTGFIKFKLRAHTCTDTQKLQAVARACIYGQRLRVCRVLKAKRIAPRPKTIAHTDIRIRAWNMLMRLQAQTRPGRSAQSWRPADPGRQPSISPTASGSACLPGTPRGAGDPVLRRRTARA